MPQIIYPTAGTKVILDTQYTVLFELANGRTVEEVKLSFDQGNSWYDITSECTDITTTSLKWTPTSTSSYTDEFENDKIFKGALLKIVDDEDNGIISSAFDLLYPPFMDVIPNKTIYGDSGSARLYLSTPINITWKEIFPSGISKVNIYYKVGNSNYVLLNSTPANNDGQYLWYNNTVTGSGIKIKIVPIDDSVPGDNELPYFILSDTDGGFNIIDTPNSTDDGYNVGVLDDYPVRTDMFARVSGEKAILPDEFVTLSQLEADGDVEIIQRDINGRILDDDPESAFRAYNVLFRLKKPIPTVPTVLTGTLDFTTDYTVIQSTQYGEIRKKTITHNLNLNPSLKYFMEFQQIKAFNDYGQPSDNSVVSYEPASENSIDVYCNIKDENKVKDPNGNNNPLSATYKFYWRLQQII